MAAPMYGSPPPLASAQIRGMFNQTAAWMRRVGYGVPNSQVFVLPRVYGSPGGVGRRALATAIHDDTGITLSKEEILNQMATLARAVYSPHPQVVVRNLQPTPYDAMVMMHELTHGLTPKEGMADSAAVDLFPAWWSRFIGGRRGADPPTYPTALARFRMASAQATGQPWTSRAARVWRRAQTNARGAG